MNELIKQNNKQMKQNGQNKTKVYFICAINRERVSE